MTAVDELLDAAHQRPSRWVPADAPFGSSWNDFLAWVKWLNSTYELELAPCWEQHGGLVNILAALWHSWRAAYAAPAGLVDISPAHNGPAQWHASLLLPFRDRIARPDGCPGGGCRARGHR